MPGGMIDMKLDSTSRCLRQTLQALLIAGAAASLPAQSAERGLDATVFIDISRAILPSVVNISVEPKTPKPGMTDKEKQDQLLQYFMQRRGDMSSLLDSVSGSGVLIGRKDNLGYVLTNNHVVRPLNDNSELKLTFHQREDGSTEYNRTTVISGDDVRIVGSDRLSDIAVIEFAMPHELDIKPVEFADSDKAEIGENVLALGNPLGFNHSITQGIISGKSRDLGTGISIEKLFQTSVVIQPGNSGGPLVNLDGKIVGINNAIASRNGYWQGTSFAIPGNEAKRIADQMIDKGRALRGYLGVTMRNVAEFGKEIAIPYQLEDNAGVLISVVVRNSPADIAGIHVLDVVTAIDDQKINGVDEMLKAIALKPVNATIKLSIIRMGDEKQPTRLDMMANLAERPNDKIIEEIHRQYEGNNSIPIIQEEAGAGPDHYLGLDMETYLDVDRNVSGLFVNGVDENSKPYAGGIRPGDVIVSLNGRSVRTLSDFASAMTQPVEGNHVIRYMRNFTPATIQFSAEPEAQKEPTTP